MSAPAAPLDPARSKRVFWLRLIAALVMVVALAWSAWYFLEARWYVSTEDAYASGNIVQISSLEAGTVVSINADDGDYVQAGQLLVALDPSDSEVALQLAKAKLAQTVRQVQGLYNDLKAAEAEVQARKTDARRVQEDYQRRLGLAKTGSISEESLNHARDALVSAQSALITAEQKYHNTQALAGSTRIAEHPNVKAAEAQVLQAYLASARTQIVAPTAGYIAKRTVQIGERVAPGRALLAVIPLHQLWVEANFKETQLNHMRIGQPVELVADLYGEDVVYHGKVDSLGMGTGSAFSLLPAQNATGNWIKVVQRVPVRVQLDPAELKAHPLRIGLSMIVTVDVHDRNGEVLAQQAVTEPAYRTTVYQQQLDAAHQLISSIVQANLGTN